MSPPPTAEMRSLVDRMLDQGGLSNVETGRLEELLEKPDALRYYSEMLLQESLMAEALRDVEAAPQVVRFPARRLVIGILAAAACLMLSLWVFKPGNEPAVVPQVVYTTSDVKVTGLQGVEWSDSISPVRSDGRLEDEHLVTRGGFLELTYPNGVRVTLQGATDFKVRDMNSGVLTSGRLVAHVPPGAEGFTVDYGSGKVVDLGTEFGLARHEGRIDLSVFDGTVEMHLPDGTSQKLSVGESLRYDEAAETVTMSLPGDAPEFVRKLPDKELSWEIDTSISSVIEFDVSAMITKPGKYMAIFKKMGGAEVLCLAEVELLLDGKRVLSEARQLYVRTNTNPKFNSCVFDLKSEDFAPGRWTVRATTVADASSKNGSTLMNGIFLLEQGMVFDAQPEDFIGRWSYHFDGKHFVREFHKDGSVTLEVNGIGGHVYFVGSRWTVENGVLKADLPAVPVHEYHVLRDPKTLIFTSNPYENAVKIEDK